MFTYAITNLTNHRSVFLKDSRFSEELIWHSTLFQSLGKKILKNLLPITNLMNNYGIIMFMLYFSLACLVVNHNLKRSLIKLGFNLLTVLHNSVQSAFNLLKFIEEVAEFDNNFFCIFISFFERRSFQVPFSSFQTLWKFRSRF